MQNHANTLKSICNFLSNQHPELSKLMAERHKINLSNKIRILHNNTIAYGPFRGMKLSNHSSWGISDKGTMILGLYEKELLDEFNNIPKSYETFIDLGAADGYYGVGVLVNGLFKNSYCYELTEAGRNVILETAKINKVESKVQIRGKATNNITSEISHHELSKSVLFIDIEGGEFELLTEPIFESFKNSIIFVEIHDFFFEDSNAKLLNLFTNSSKTHTKKIIKMGQRDLSKYPELTHWDDLDRWMLCSEGRAKLMTWIRFDPIETINIEEKFTKIFQGNHWGDTESKSGPGSTLSYTANIRNLLPKLFESFAITSIFDAPCGDFGWMKSIIEKSEIKYIGADIVKPLIDELNENNSSKNISFQHLDLTNSFYPSVDLMICRDCLFHLSYNDIKLILKNFIDSNSKYFLTSSHVNRTSFSNTNINSGGFRLIDLFNAPFNFPKNPLFSIEDWKPPHPERHMFLFDKAQIQIAYDNLKFI